nr:HEPN family nuclease [Bacillus thuringiensis]
MAIEKKFTLADLSIMFQGNISLKWIQECKNPENENKKVGDLVSEFEKNNNNFDLFNSSIILMASYLFFMYPKEKDFKIVDYKSVDTSKFNVLKCEKKKELRDSKYICKRVRNALAHSNVHIAENMLITFEDDNPQKTDYFKCTISHTDFGEFINAFLYGIKDGYFKNRV